VNNCQILIKPKLNPNDNNNNLMNLRTIRGLGEDGYNTWLWTRGSKFPQVFIL